MEQPPCPRNLAVRRRSRARTSTSSDNHVAIAMCDAARMAFGTADPDAPVSRADFERALRHLNISDLELRDAVLQLAARIVALTDELVRRVDGVEPDPAPPNTPASAPSVTIENAVGAMLPMQLAHVRAGDAAQPTRVSLDLGPDKYEVEPSAIPCDELIHLCHARCCRLTFALSTKDLDEGVIRWDYGQPYLIRQRETDGYCVHNDPTSRGCTVHAFRPRVCRLYDCRKDSRVWIDYDKRIPAPHFEGKFDDKGSGSSFDLVERARSRHAALVVEKKAIGETFADRAAVEGPEPRPIVRAIPKEPEP
jgi:hypothetical protein